METHHQVCFTNASSVHNVLQAIFDCWKKKRSWGKDGLKARKWDILPSAGLHSLTFTLFTSLFNQFFIPSDAPPILVKTNILHF